MLEGRRKTEAKDRKDSIPSGKTENGDPAGEESPKKVSLWVKPGQRE